MGFLNKIFASIKRKSDDSDPNNGYLNILLNRYAQNSSQANYELVMKELLHGNSFLVLPTVNNEISDYGWQKAEYDTTLNLTSVFNLDGLKVLGAFSDEEHLVKWAKKEVAYTAVKSQAVLEMCIGLDVKRVIINSDSPQLFIVERYRNQETFKMETGTQVFIGSPGQPIDKHIIQNLILNFSELDTVSEAYQYMQTKNGQSNLVLGLKLRVNTDNAKKALLYAVQAALSKESKEFFLDIVFLDTKDLYRQVKEIEGALFYAKS